MVAHLRFEFRYSGHFELLNVEIGHTRVLASLAFGWCSLALGRSLASLGLLLGALSLLSGLLSLVLGQSLSLQFLLFLLSFEAKLLLNFFTTGLFVDLEGA